MKRGEVVSLRKIEEISLEYLLLTTASLRSGCGTPATWMLLCVASKIAHLPPAGVTALLLPTQPATRMLLCAAPLIARLPPAGVTALFLPTQPATRMLLCAAPLIALLLPAGVTALLLPTQPATWMLLCATPLIARLPPTGVAPFTPAHPKMFFLHRMKKPLL